MAGITIKGIRVESINLLLSKESGSMELQQAEYSLISSVDKVLAKQTIGGYNSMKVEASRDTLNLLEKFVESYKKDVSDVLGLETA